MMGTVYKTVQITQFVRRYYRENVEECANDVVSKGVEGVDDEQRGNDSSCLTNEGNDEVGLNVCDAPEDKENISVDWTGSQQWNY